MDESLIAFRRKLVKGGLAMFFYSGHGMQVKGGNYLVPLGAQPQEESQVKYQCFDVGQVLDLMTESGCNLKVVVLDCCRDNPFQRSWSRNNSRKGLAGFSDVPQGTIIAFSTSPNATAADGDGRNSPSPGDIKRVTTPTPPGQPAIHPLPVEQAGSRWAVLIGVDDYSEVHKLRFAGNDQRALAEQLIASGFPQDQVFLLHDKATDKKYLPFRENIEKQLAIVLATVSPGDLVIVGFSGHGVQWEGKSYLCPEDTRVDKLPATLIPLDSVYEQMVKCKAALKLLLVDACGAAALGRTCGNGNGRRVSLGRGR